MTSQVEIFNMALTNLSAKAFVQTLTEDSLERKYCSANYAAAVEAVLEEHDWKFASGFKTLSLSGDATVKPWLYRYDFPSDCIKMREIVKDSDDDDEIPFDEVLDEAKTGKNILTDQDKAVGRYTVRVTNANLFSPLFAEAVAWKLAARS